MSKQIDRRQFLKGMGALASAPFLSSVGPRQERRRPNVLFILMDDMTHKAIDNSNDSDIQTPNLDRLAQRGTTFTHTFNQGSWSGAVCVPARSMLITGLNLWHAHGAHNEYENVSLWGETFAQHGYETYFSGKWHLGDPSAKRFANHIGPHAKDFSRGMLLSSGNQYSRIHKPGQELTLPKDRERWLAKLTESWKENPKRPWHADNQSLAGHWITANDDFDHEWIRKHSPYLEHSHSAEIWTEAAIDFLKHPPSGGKKPLFMHLAFFSPHDPRQSPTSWLNRYSKNDIEVPPNFLPEFPFDQGSHKNRDEVLAPFPRSRSDIQVHRREYYALISYIDHTIGRLLDTLDETGMRDETIVIFTSDHGLAVGEHGLMGKQTLFDHSTRVPLIMAGPGIPSGHKVDRMLYHSGLFSTICELVDISIPDTVEQESFADLATGQQRNTAQKPIYGAYKKIQRSVRTQRYKLIEYRKDNQKHTQLFDLQENPWEILSHNLAEDPANAPLVKEMRNRLHELQKEYDDPMELV